MPPTKGEEWKHVAVVDDKAENHPKIKCVYCSKVFVGGAAKQLWINILRLWYDVGYIISGGALNSLAYSRPVIYK